MRAAAAAAGRLGPRSVQLSRKANLGPLVFRDDDTEVMHFQHTREEWGGE